MLHPKALLILPVSKQTGIFPMILEKTEQIIRKSSTESEIDYPNRIDFFLKKGHSNTMRLDYVLQESLNNDDCVLQ